MISKSLVSLLVGSHFRPPAKTLLAHLPSGCPLTLEPEPENPYDPDAVRVLLDPKDIPEGEWEALSSPYDGLPTQGATLEQVLSSGPIHLGYIAAEKNKERIAGGYAKAAEFHDWIRDPEHEAQLRFSPEGKPLVVLRIDEEGGE